MLQQAEEQQAENEQFRDGGKAFSKKSKRKSQQVLTTRGTVRDFILVHYPSALQCFAAFVG